MASLIRNSNNELNNLRQFSRKCYFCKIVADEIEYFCSRSVKHYFLLDQGDFIVQFMDMADDEMKKNMDGK